MYEIHILAINYIYWAASRELHAVQITYRAWFENDSYTVLHKESQKKNVTYGDGLLHTNMIIQKENQ